MADATEGAASEGARDVDECTEEAVAVGPGRSAACKRGVQGEAGRDADELRVARSAGGDQRTGTTNSAVDSVSSTSVSLTALSPA